MASEATHARILVCTGCTHGVAKKERDGERGGERLAAALERLSAHEGGAVSVERVSCLSSCDASCAVAVHTTGGHTFVLAGLPGEEFAPDLVEFARRCLQAPEGKLSKKDRPEPLRDLVIARIPPL